MDYRWEEAMGCVNKKGINSFPSLVAFMPSVAKLVLNNCVTREGDPESKDFALTYNFKYIDPHPLSVACKNGKAWYVNVSIVIRFGNLTTYSGIHVQY